MQTQLLLALAVLASSVAARNAPVNLPLSRRIDLNSAQKLLEYDQKRANALKSGLVSRSGPDSEAVNAQTWFTSVTNRPLSHTVPVCHDHEFFSRRAAYCLILTV